MHSKAVRPILIATARLCFCCLQRSSCCCWCVRNLDIIKWYKGTALGLLQSVEQQPFDKRATEDEEKRGPKMVHRYYPHTIDLRSLSLSLRWLWRRSPNNQPFFITLYGILHSGNALSIYVFLLLGSRLLRSIPFHPAIRSLWKDGWRRIIPKTTTITWLAGWLWMFTATKGGTETSFCTHMCAGNGIVGCGWQQQQQQHQL